jgi:carbamoyltransferase
LAQHLMPDVRVHVQPAAGDAGVAVGAAVVVANVVGSLPHLDPMCVYSGPQFSQGTVADELKNYGLRFTAPSDQAEVAIDRLVQGRVVARFDGRAEFGPRALGNRSLLADPSATEIRDRVNRIKQREPWRPLSPVVSRKHSELLFGRDLDSPYMLFAVTVTEAMRDRVPAVVHRDATARPQIVSDANSRLNAIVDGYAQVTGVPALMNTSFNTQEPLVLTPADAVRTFFTSGVDDLLIEGLLVSKD